MEAIGWQWDPQAISGVHSLMGLHGSYPTAHRVPTGHILHPNGSHLLSQWVPSVPSYSAVVPHGTHLRPPQVPPYILKGHTLKPCRSVARHTELGCVKPRVKTCRAEPG